MQTSVGYPVGNDPNRGGVDGVRIEFALSSQPASPPFGHLITDVLV